MAILGKEITSYALISPRIAHTMTNTEQIILIIFNLFFSSITNFYFPNLNWTVVLFHRVKNPEQFCRRDHNGGSWEMLRVSRDQICSLLGKGNLVEHYILGVGKDFFGLGPFQREALLKNHIQYSINQLGREMELGPGKDIVSITAYTISSPPSPERFLC